MHLIRAEVAGDDAARTRGLMHRKSLDTNAGMLFLFEHRSIHCMWMKNTLIPLSVASTSRPRITSRHGAHDEIALRTGPAPMRSR